MIFRDRDAPITQDGLIFRTYGYDHPKRSCFCDLEYVKGTIYKSENPKAVRNGLPQKYYKFYFDGGLKFAIERGYQIHHKPLNKMLVGIKEHQLSYVLRPKERLLELFRTNSDQLVKTTIEVLDLIIDSSKLKIDNFGVFGSLAHGFHNPKYSDIDLVVYGQNELIELRSILKELYEKSPLKNEFELWNIQDPPLSWNFINYSKKEYGDHQKKKLIYALYDSKIQNRKIKVEFEPVKKWEEIHNEYEKTLKIENLGFIKAVGKIKSDNEAGFMPSIYPVEIIENNRDIELKDIKRIINYVEEFRLQLESGDIAQIQGNLERVTTINDKFFQITISYGQNYFYQTLKRINSTS